MPRQSFTLGIGEAGAPRTWPWKLVLHGDDVYVMRVDGSAQTKVSFHADGKCQFSTTSEAWANLGRPNSERHINRWLKPVEFAPGFVSMFRIMFPSRYTKSSVPMPNTHIDAWRSLPDTGMLQVFLILSDSATAAGVSGWPGRESLGSGLLWRGSLNCGDVLWLVSACGPVDEKQLDQQILDIARREQLEPGYYYRAQILQSPAKDGSRGILEAEWRLALSADGVVDILPGE